MLVSATRRSLQNSFDVVAELEKKVIGCFMASALPPPYVAWFVHIKLLSRDVRASSRMLSLG